VRISKRICKGKLSEFFYADLQGIRLEVTKNRPVIWVSVAADCFEDTKFPAVIDTGFNGTILLTYSLLRHIYRGVGAPSRHFKPLVGQRSKCDLPLVLGDGYGPYSRIDLSLRIFDWVGSQVPPDGVCFHESFLGYDTRVQLEESDILGRLAEYDGRDLHTRNVGRRAPPRIPLIGTQALFFSQLSLKSDGSRFAVTRK